MDLSFYNEARKIWNNLSGYENVEKLSFELEIHKKLLNIFQVGDYYYFIFNIARGDFEQISPEISDLLGYEAHEVSADFYLNNIHPEDQPYFLNFENKLRVFFKSLPIDKIYKYKIRYDFRIKNSNGNYIRILHQMVFIQHDEKGNLTYSLGVHTDVTHLKEHGIPILSFIGMDGEPSYINVKVEELFKPSKELLSNREKDILMLLIVGDSSKQIGSKLNISKLTVDTHRKTMLKKTNCVSTYQMISKAINEGWI
uniref:LuxR C-terminal-related transcriptional regulator n=1 Tax=Gelidibacter sp. TaxID=2018083 RepID=UPI00404AB235